MTVNEYPGRPVEKYAWPGGYEIAYVTDDGEVLCADCVNNPTNPVHAGGLADGWRVEGRTHTGETDEPMSCAHCGRAIGDIDEPQPPRDLYATREERDRFSNDTDEPA